MRRHQTIPLLHRCTIENDEYGAWLACKCGHRRWLGITATPRDASDPALEHVSQFDLAQQHSDGTLHRRCAAVPTGRSLGDHAQEQDDHARMDYTGETGDA